MQVQYPLDSGPMAQLSEVEKKKRLDAMVRIWQSDTEKLIGREGSRAFITAAGRVSLFRLVTLPRMGT